MENAIGKRVKEIRAELKMSQSQFAESIGVSKSLISLIELGRKNPSIETINKIANKGNVSIDYVMGLSDNKNIEENQSSGVMLELQHYINKVEKFDDETKEFAIKKIKALIYGLDLENEK
ncbi:helix-turn-helix domain-containing protein [Bacillus sp. BP-3]|uniref:helix-turn-helix domain-containing protein n=1 Tax=Bacillus sp. BP-3 TaxID=3022773 RepID=UPI00232DE37A|nr:helix-turn-helix transcriptional regulator [Bacillus sp. BP-3]MDC2867540.1 helix-turn-helix transcriptional regulator [Bacillus sp. BP-3]